MADPRFAHNVKRGNDTFTPSTPEEAVAVLDATDVPNVDDDDFWIAFKMRGEMIVNGAADRVELQRTIDGLRENIDRLRAENHSLQRSHELVRDMRETTKRLRSLADAAEQIDQGVWIEPDDLRKLCDLCDLLGGGRR